MFSFPTPPVPLSKREGMKLCIPTKNRSCGPWNSASGQSPIFDRCPILFSGVYFSIAVIVTYAYLGCFQSVA